MRAVLLLYFSFIIFLATPVFAKDRTTDTIVGRPGATVLIYHRFGDDRYPTTNVSVDRFREQLTYLRENGYRVILLEELVRSLQDGGDLPDKAVVITIDDGYKSVYEYGWPLLKEFGFPFTVFLYAKATQNKHWDYMTWEQVRELQAAGVDFQNHGYAHDHLAFRPAGMDADAYRAWIREDLEASTRILSAALSEEPRFFAIPYGEYNKTVLDEIRAFGYEAILLQDPGSVSNDTDPYAIPREPILGNEWSTLDHFRMVLERVDLPIIGEIPAYGQLADKTPGKFGATLLHPERYIPGTLGIYVSELGWQGATIQGSFAGIANDRTLNRRINRVAISGREKESGRTAIRYWMLVREEIEDLRN